MVPPDGDALYNNQFSDLQIMVQTTFSLQSMEIHDHLSCLCTQFLPQLARQCVRRQIRWRALHAALGEHTSPRSFSYGIVLANHVLDPEELSAHVDVMRAVLGTGFDDRLAIFYIGADTGEEDIGTLGECVQLSLTVYADDLNACTLRSVNA